MPRGKETTLTQQEKLSVTHLLRPQTSNFAKDDETEQRELSFNARMRQLDEQSKRQQVNASNTKHVNKTFISGTSNICERFFSRTKHIMTPARAGRMDPSTFEDIMILSYNSDLWNSSSPSNFKRKEN